MKLEILQLKTCTRCLVYEARDISLQWNNSSGPLFGTDRLGVNIPFDVRMEGMSHPTICHGLDFYLDCRVSVLKLCLPPGDHCVFLRYLGKLHHSRPVAHCWPCNKPHQMVWSWLFSWSWDQEPSYLVYFHATNLKCVNATLDMLSGF